MNGARIALCAALVPCLALPVLGCAAIGNPLVLACFVLAPLVLLGVPDRWPDWQGAGD